MNKELTPLEVSKQLKDFVLEFVKNGLDRRFIHGSFGTIETALKDYDMLLEEYNLMKKEYESDNKKIARWKEIAMTFEKPVRALEEIQSLVNFDICEIQGQWYLCLGNVFLKALKKPISKETADLLKEVLL